MAVGGPHEDAACPCSTCTPAPLFVPACLVAAGKEDMAATYEDTARGALARLQAPTPSGALPYPAAQSGRPNARTKFLNLLYTKGSCPRLAAQHLTLLYVLPFPGHQQVLYPGQQPNWA